jgi:hypothetical protein
MFRAAYGPLAFASISSLETRNLLQQLGQDVDYETSQFGQSDALSNIRTQFVQAEQGRFHFNSVLRTETVPLKSRRLADRMNP